MKRTLFLFSLSLLILTGFFGVTPGVGAAENTQSAVTQTYGTNQQVQRGMLVRLADDDKAKVRPVEQAKEADVTGVVVAANEAALALTSDDGTRQAYVANSGRYYVLVSNQNGVINKGDLVGISALEGVGMKADAELAVVIGRAIETFTGMSNVVSNATLEKKDGKSVDVSVGRILVDIGITGNPLRVENDTSSLNGMLQRITSTVSNKPVSPIRAYLSLVLLILTAVISGSIIYGGVRSGITAIGRNPLARRNISSGLVQVFVMGFGVLIIGLFGVYLLLKL